MKDLMTFSEAADICPGKPSAASLSRWRRQGIKTRSGVIVRLQCLRSGKQYFTSEIWLREFFNECARLDLIDPEPKPITFTSQVGNARQRLIDEGVLL